MADSEYDEYIDDDGHWEVRDDDDDENEAGQGNQQSRARRLFRLSAWKNCCTAFLCCTNLERLKWNMFAYTQFLVLPLLLFIIWVLVPIGGGEDPQQRCTPYWFDWPNSTCQIALNHNKSIQESAAAAKLSSLWQDAPRFYSSDPSTLDRGWFTVRSSAQGSRQLDEAAEHSAGHLSKKKNLTDAVENAPRSVKCRASFPITVTWLCIYLAVGFFWSLLMLDILQPGCPARYIGWTAFGVSIATLTSIVVLRFAVPTSAEDAHSVAVTSEFILLVPFFINLIGLSLCYCYYVWVWAEERERMKLNNMFRRNKAPRLNVSGSDPDEIVVHRNRDLPRPPTFNEFDQHDSSTIVFAAQDLDSPDWDDDDDSSTTGNSSYGTVGDGGGEENEQANPAVHDLAQHSEDALNIWEVLRQEQPVDERTSLLQKPAVSPSPGVARRNERTLSATNSDLASSPSLLSEGTVQAGGGEDQSLPPEIKQRLASIRRLNRQSWSHRIAHLLFHINTKKVKRINDQLVKYTLLGTTAASWTIWDQDNWENKLALSFGTVFKLVMLKIAVMATWVILNLYVDLVVVKVVNDYMLFFLSATVFLIMRLFIMTILTGMNNALPSLPEIRYFVFFAGQMYFELAFRSLFLFAGNWKVIGSIAALQALITLWTYSFQLSHSWFNFFQIRCRAMACCKFTQCCFLDPDHDGHVLTYESHIANKSIRFYYANVSKGFSVISFLLIFLIIYKCPWLLPYYPTLQLCPAKAVQLVWTYIFLASVELITGLLVYLIAWKVIKVDIGFHARIATILDSRTRFFFAVTCLVIYMDMPISLFRFAF